ncbi:acyl-CoA synthetase [Treponema sp. R8-4-B8]
MASKLRNIPKVLFFIAAALYPALIFYFLVIRKIPLRMFSIFVIAFALIIFITLTSGKKGTKGISFLWNSVMLLVLGSLCLILNSAVILKLYPVIMNILFLITFGGTLFSPPSMIFRFATMQDRSIKGSLNEKRVAGYCRKVTYVWCGFFIFNGSVAAFTIFYGSDILWSVYNGLISYILIGVLFAGEFMVRKIVQKNMPQSVPLSAFKNNSRPRSTVLCYEGRWSDAVYKTWGDFLEGTSELRRVINSRNDEKWLLHCEDCWYFLLALTALLQCKKEILLSANVSPAYIEEIRGGAAGGSEQNAAQSSAPFFTDQIFPEGETPRNTFHIPSLLNSPRKTESLAADTQAEEAPAINADETSIIMYTSGSTGKPKAVRQRLTEFEADNRFIISKWGDEFLKRKLLSTVSQHHIYGILFSIFLPFTLGAPFRRRRIEFPEEMEKFSDTEYMIITVPAFLKRAVEMESPSALNLKSPWIFTSGGALKFDTAKKTNEVFGFWPVEVYGSTETSGIAWRQSVNGQEWTVFDNAKISQNQEGCLIIRSPYIKDPAGFETADMVEILEDGRFLLKGRIDSVVKIEEKRISFPEIENRILQSGLVSDVCVISLEDKRQYLAAVMVFNGKGKERFDGLEKIEINNFWREYLLKYFENIVIPKKWRYLDMLPMDAQGKKKKEDILLLFSGAETAAERGNFKSASSASAGFKIDNEKIIEKTENSVTLEFSIPNTSPYFDGHFTGFPILPAVAQTELVLRFAARHLGTSVTPSEIKRVKFTNFIRPDAPLLLKLSKKEKTLSFNLSSPKGETVYSLGTVIMGDK